MQKQLNFDTQYTITVKEETTKGFLLKFRPYKAGATPDVDPDVICPIADLNKIAIDVVLRRANGNSGQFTEIRQFEGYLNDYLLGLYAQNTKLELVTKQTTSGYLTFIDMSPSVIALRGEDELVIKINVPKTAWTGTVASRSSIEFLTMSAIGETPFIPQVKAFPIGNGEFQFDKDLGNGIVKIVAGTDFTADYLTSTKSKIVSGDIRANGRGGLYEKNFTEPQLLAENMHYFDNNPESDVEDLVLHWAQSPLDRVKLRFKLDKPADQDAKVLTLGLVSAR